MELDLWMSAAEHILIRVGILALLVIALYKVIRHEIRK
jgi:hypothetical protein